ncbi:cytochrome P450 [Candidatus Flexifilum breve]
MPERFRRAMKSGSNYSYMPFGAGVRAALEDRLSRR